MSKDSFRHLVEQIRRLALEAPPPPPAGHRVGPESPPPPAPGASQPISGRPHDKNIAEMQKAMITLAKAVTNQLGAPEGQGVTSQEVAGKDSFGDFFTKHYLRNSDVPSVEFTPDPTKVKREEKDPRTPSKLSWVMDTMRRIGKSTDEGGFADGNWGFRTNQALNNIYAFAYGLLNLAHDFELPIKSYSERSLSSMKPALVEDEKSIPLATKSKIAPALTQHIMAIARMYEEVKKGILEKPQYRAYIESDKPYLRHDKGPNLTSEQMQSLRATFQHGFDVPVSQNRTAHIGIDDLMNAQSLKAWVEKNAPQQNPSNIVSSVATQVSPNRRA